MKIEFEWNTRRIENSQKDEIEKDIKQKIFHHLDQAVKTPIKSLVVSLFDERVDYQITGAAFSIENGEKTEIIKNIKINPGIKMEIVKNANIDALLLLNEIPHTPVQRNTGIDAFLTETYRGVPIPVRVQRQGESISDDACALHKAAKTKKA